MNERLKTTLVLLVLVVATGLAAYRQQVQRTRLVYADSLDMVALTVDGEEIDLRDMAVYVALQEKKVQQEALVYNPGKPESYWNAYTNQHFVRAVAENAIKDMAAHDEIFYRMAVSEGVELSESEEAYLANELIDFFMDVSDEQMAQLGVEDEDIEAGMYKIALANKYQSILAQMEGVAYEEYDYTGTLYEALLSGHEVSMEKEVWSRIAVGNITVNYKKKTVKASEDAGTE
ncbi:MAG: hypothetical protein IKB01_10590 [Lachnospiraceae bacterium]|nr:hypothetical protein [Lachnospiraceae bacterium]